MQAIRDARMTGADIALDWLTVNGHAVVHALVLRPPI
jgi:hypothetical protein